MCVSSLCFLNFPHNVPLSVNSDGLGQLPRKKLDLDDDERERAVLAA